MLDEDVRRLQGALDLAQAGVEAAAALALEAQTAITRAPYALLRGARVPGAASIERAQSAITQVAYLGVVAVSRGAHGAAAALLARARAQ